MTHDIEDQLRQLFTDDAAGVTAPADLALRVRRRARLQRRSALALAASVAAVAGAVVVGLGLLGQPGPGSRGVASSTGSTATSTSTSTSTTSTGGSASCVQTYSPEAVTGAAFAVDGTVRAIDDSVSYDVERRVTLQVNHWYAGQSVLTAPSSPQAGAEGDLVIDMPAPNGDGGVYSSEGLSYAVGERLLVSGAVRDGLGSGGIQGPIAWGCGFTVAYDAATAAAWQDAFDAALG